MYRAYVNSFFYAFAMNSGCRFAIGHIMSMKLGIALRKKDGYFRCLRVKLVIRILTILIVWATVFMDLEDGSGRCDKYSARVTCCKYPYPLQFPMLLIVDIFGGILDWV
jgi:hypothetical protein